MKKKLSDGSESESSIQKAILGWLKTAGIVVWRQNSGSVFNGNRRVRLGDAGLPDIVCVVPPGGLFLGLEVKSERGRLRPMQAEFRDAVQAVGGMYRVVRSLEEAKNALAEALGKKGRMLEGWETYYTRYR